MAQFSKESSQYIMGNAANGPLASLYSNSYDFSSRFYPRNLGSETRGHYINFYINVANASQYSQQGKYTVFDTNGRTGTNQAVSAAALGENVGQVADVLTTRKTKRISQAIALYMPESMTVQYNADWQSSSLTDAGGTALRMAQAGSSIYDAAKASSGGLMDTLKNIAMDPGAAEIAGGVAQNVGLGAGAGDFLMYATGRAINPQLQVLFKGVDFRTFQFEFLFAPFDEGEAQNVLEIIKTFKFHQAPEINASGMGRYFVPPSEFDIDFLFNGQINSNVNQVGTCVLTNMNVDYSPNGWSTFTNGMPTHIRLTLQFMETEIVTKQRVDEDNY